MVDIKSAREIELMKEACRITKLTHEELEKALRPGISTYELDKIAENFIKSQVSKWNKRSHSNSCNNMGFN